MSYPDISTELQELLNYLEGYKPYNGAWFGEVPEMKRGIFWWRKELRPLIEQQREADLAAISYHFAIPVSDLKKVLMAKPQQRNKSLS